MSGCHYPSPPPQDQDRRYQHKVSLVVRYFMIPCNICLILLAMSTLGFAVLLFLNNCTLVQLITQKCVFDTGSLFGKRILTLKPKRRKSRFCAEFRREMN